MHIADRSYAVYRLTRVKGPVLESWEVKPHGKPALLAVERAMQTLDVRRPLAAPSSAPTPHLKTRSFCCAAFCSEALREACL